MDYESDQDHGSMTSIVHIQPSEAFPKKTLQKEDPTLTSPFPVLIGEKVEYLGRTTEGTIALSDYRLFIHINENKFYNIVLGLIDSVECRDIFFLYIHCKDARTVRCTFATNELCQDWYKRLLAATAPPKKLEDIFALAHFAYGSQEPKDDYRQTVTPDNDILSLEVEVKRMGFDLERAWRISRVNEQYELCPSYPRDILVPKGIMDEDLTNVATFRSSQRIPAVIWRHPRNGSVIARCSQPEVGWLGWRNGNDEKLILSIAESCAKDGKRLGRDQNGGSDLKNVHPPKVLIVDARSYAAAVANRAKGGGCECPEYYPSCEIQFMSLANIHSIRRSFQSIRALCAASGDQPNWYSVLENTKWLQNISGLLKSALVVVNAVDREGRPVVVHCSDGWDRTPQIVALAELMLDPYYRTFQGFQVLVEREWLEFGHKFGDRCGHGLQADDPNERCPVFLQWLDCVHQLWNQFSLCFEFNQNFLVKLAQHAYSCLYGTFLCNTSQERRLNRVQERTYSVWPALQNNKRQFSNYLYEKSDSVLRPSCQLRDLYLWSAVYVQHMDYMDEPEMSSDSLGNPEPEVGEEINGQVSEEVASNGVRSCSSKTIDDGVGNGVSSLTKTKSCADLSLVAEHASGRPRRCSDPSVEKGTCVGAVDGALLRSATGIGDAQEETGWSQNVNYADRGIDGDIEDDSADETLSCDNESRLINKTVQLNGHFKSRVSDDEDDTELTMSDERMKELPQLHSAIESSTDTLVGDVTSELKPVGQRFKQQDCIQVDSEGANSEENCLHVSTSTTDISDSNVGTSYGTVVSCIKPLKSHLIQRCCQTLLHYNNSGGVHELSPPPPPPPVYGQYPLNGHNWCRQCTGVDCQLSSYSKCPPFFSANGTGGGSGVNGCIVPSHHNLVIEANLEAALKHLSTGSSVSTPLATSCGGVNGGGKCHSSASTPLHSRTPSSGFPATPNDDRSTCDVASHQGDCSSSSSAAMAGASPLAVARRLDTDGLVLIQDKRQRRLHEIIAEHCDQIRAMEHKLYMLQMALSQQQRCCKHSRGAAECAEDDGAFPDFCCNGEQQSLGHDSTATSDSSWEHVDEQDIRLTRWVPDHAAFRCKGCDCEFFTLRRKHHCRNCGEVFCWECSNYVIPIPNEHLYKPARVCSWCYEQLRYKPQACTVAAASAREEDKYANTIVATAAASN